MSKKKTLEQNTRNQPLSLSLLNIINKKEVTDNLILKRDSNNQ